MKRILIIIFALVFTVLIFISSLYLFGPEGPITFLDYPIELNNEIDTVEVQYINWACACANWLPTKYLEDPNYSTTDNFDDCIFIEAEKGADKVPEAYIIESHKKVKLIGRYYKDEGISRDYESPTSQRAEKAKVFKYSSFEIIK